MELLAPAGSPEALTAAVQAGADAVYLGFGPLNARRNAKNFTREELEAGVAYCHLRGVKVYLTLNTLLTNRELPLAAETGAWASDLGIDAVLVQDLGVARLLRRTCPDLPLHASTQMTVHSLDGVRACADLGMTRVVLSRELSADAIADLCARSPVELEVFGHGALCMCYSGQCFLSAVLGGRSGNRGLCAQPCRLAFRWPGEKTPSHPLSLKDLSLAGALGQLEEMGVACLKIEGRMKRPEYVAVVTGIYAAALRQGREPTQAELAQLEAAFSRQGFTQGYYLDQQGPDMFGVREETREPKELFAAARNTYQSGEAQRVPVTFYAMLRPGEPARVGVEDPDGRVATVEGPVPEAARTRPMTAEAVTTQLSRPGGTPYRCGQVRALVEENLSLHFGMPSPEGYRKAQRLMLQAEKFRRPVITFIDTPGAYPGLEAEARGQAEAIARTLALSSRLTVPVVSVVTGEGGSGGALALGVGNRVLMLENAVYSVLSPEGFAAILWKDASRSDEACGVMKLTAADLLELEVADRIIPEPEGGAHTNPAALFRTLDTALVKELNALGKLSGPALAAGRYKKFRAMGAKALRKERT